MQHCNISGFSLGLSYSCHARVQREASWLHPCKAKDTPASHDVPQYKVLCWLSERILFWSCGDKHGLIYLARELAQFSRVVLELSAMVLGQGSAWIDLGCAAPVQTGGVVQGQILHHWQNHWFCKITNFASLAFISVAGTVSCFLVTVNSPWVTTQPAHESSAESALATQVELPGALKILFALCINYYFFISFTYFSISLFFNKMSLVFLSFFSFYSTFKCF